MTTDTTSFLLVLLAAAAAPFIAAGANRIHPQLIVPIVVVELMLGAIIGPDILDLAEMNEVLSFLGDLGLGFLFFFAGYEIEIERIRGVPLRLAAIGWIISCALAYAIAGALMAAGIVLSGLLVGSAMSTTALGTILPVLRDAGQLETRLGRFVLGVGAVGEFGPVLIVTVLLGSQSDPSTQILLLAIFVVLAVLAALVSLRAVGRGWEFIEGNMETSGQVPVRLCVLLLFGLVVIAADLGLDVILGAFAAGAILRLLLRNHEAEQFESKLDALGFGLLIPFFFVTSGIKLDLEALVSSARAMIELPVFLGMFLLVRGLPAMVLYRNVLGASERKALALLSATQLPLVVAITTIGVDSGHMRTSTAAALVGAGALSVLIYPSLALTFARGPDPSDPEPVRGPAPATQPGMP
jgi:Kef-type K+ transport system membrane component KefB